MTIVPYLSLSFNQTHRLVEGFEKEYYAYKNLPKYGTINTLLALTMLHPIGRVRIMYGERHFNYHTQLLANFIHTDFGQFYISCKEDVDELVITCMSMSRNGKATKGELAHTYQ